MIPYFSIILPIYNVSEYLHRCIQSVLDQSFTDYEIILVDDGSTDESSAICNVYAEKYPFIQVIHKENGGLSSARNTGAEAARGQYIWWVDSDDWIEPEALACLYQAAGGKLPDMIKFNYFRVAPQKELFSSAAQPGYYEGKAHVNRLLEQACLRTGQYSLSACICIYRRDFLIKNKLAFVSEKVVGSEDYLFNLQAMLCAEKIQVLSQPMYNYALRDGSLSQAGYKKNLPQRYTALYLRLREYYQTAGMLERYEKDINCFYVWHLLRGTCIPNEYSVTAEHSMKEGRRNIRAFMSTDEFAYAVRHCDRRKFPLKKQILLWAMQHRLEPLFYWLYVVKPKMKKGMYHEN